MRNLALLGLALVLSLAACGGSGRRAAGDARLEQEADSYQIDQIEKIWHKASSTKDVALMMTIWAPNATFNVGTDTYAGKAQIRGFFAHMAGPFKPENDWISDTPAYKVRITVNGDKGTLYFQCHYLDRRTGKLASIVAADQDVRKIDGKWLITKSVAAPARLGS